MARLQLFAGVWLVALISSSSSSFQGYDMVFNRVTSDSEDSDNPRALLTDSNGSPVTFVGFNDRVTICLLVFLENQKTDYVALFNYSNLATPTLHQISLMVDYAEGNTTLYINGEASPFEVTPPRNKWTHICVDWDSASGSSHLYIDGELSGSDVSIMQSYVVYGGGNFILGANPSSQQFNFVPRDGVEGKITQFNYWNKVLLADEVKRVQNCQLEGNVVSWKTSNWTLLGNISLEPTDAPCGNGPEKMTLEELTSLFLNARTEFSRQLQDSDQRINALESNFREGQAEIVSLKEELGIAANELNNVKQAAEFEISELKKRIDIAEKFLDTFKKEAENEISSLKKTAGDEISALYRRFEVAEKTLTEFKQTAQKEITSLKQSAGNEIGSLKNNFQAAETGLNEFKKSAQEEIASLKQEAETQISSINRKVDQCCSTMPPN